MDDPQMPYNTADTIGTLLGSDASEIAFLNYISSTSDKIPTDQLILVPVSCTCSGNIFQYLTPYVFAAGENYVRIAHEIFQSLTTCQAVAGENNYSPDLIPTETEFIFPVRCACPSEKQSASGVTSLLTYTIYNDTDVTSIGEMFGADRQSILEANMSSQNSPIYNFTPILVPLKKERCSTDPDLFFCKCSNGHLADGKCSSNDKGLPAKLVVNWPRTTYHIAITIGHLLGSEASEIASLNHISSLADKIPTDKLILGRVVCWYSNTCPTEKQTATGVSSLLTYTIYKDDVVTSIAEKFGVDQRSILEANMLSQNSSIYLFTPILVPLKRESCSIYPELFFCKCPIGYLPDGNCSANDKSFQSNSLVTISIPHFQS
ncbi:hypothetical protein FEM48_Zijuj02G0182000 [Ziziphus jujuba var. spinosa]|uniref:LysM domain-containing protein n=1 Tax=Ziziphus jujuba var. spinosa TaxID=714518 RepID=A0A978VX75_ZIZJJ|nr:hypothetical protein FEM48_Zijuj02G0182000 [Ziziphus jujuba var. spinosa]